MRMETVKRRKIEMKGRKNPTWLQYCFVWNYYCQSLLQKIFLLIVIKKKPRGEKFHRDDSSSLVWFVIIYVSEFDLSTFARNHAILFALGSEQFAGEWMEKVCNSSEWKKDAWPRIWQNGNLLLFFSSFQAFPQLTKIVILLQNHISI